jgi:hypothetical protein
MLKMPIRPKTSAQPEIGKASPSLKERVAGQHDLNWRYLAVTKTIDARHSIEGSAMKCTQFSETFGAHPKSEGERGTW